MGRFVIIVGIGLSMICECGLDLSDRMDHERLQKFFNDREHCPDCGRDL